MPGRAFRATVAHWLHRRAGGVGRRSSPLAWRLAGAAIVLLLVVAALAAGRMIAPDGDRVTPQVSGGVPLPSTGAPTGAAGDPDDAVARITAQPGHGLSLPATTDAAFAVIPPVTRIAPLPDTADPALLEPRAGGDLPRTAADGRQPWQAYARPFGGADDRPRLVIIIAGLGLSAAAADAAIRRLPGEVTLAFDPLAADLAGNVGRARRHGHETLTQLPIESDRFPFLDPGPDAIRAADGEAANRDRLERILAAAPTSVGVLATGGPLPPAALRPLLAVMGERGLIIVSAGPMIGSAGLAPAADGVALPGLAVDRIIDEPAEAAAIDAALAALEDLARAQTVAVGLGRPLPVTLARVRAWAATLDDRRLALAPATAGIGLRRWPQ